jgi:hypothetical protein
MVIELQVEGAITVQPLAFEVKGFKDYFLKLKPESNNRNLTDFGLFRVRFRQGSLYMIENGIKQPTMFLIIH